MKTHTIKIKDNQGDDGNTYENYLDGVYRKTVYEYAIAIPNKDLNGWKENSNYDVHVCRLWNNRFCIYKSSYESTDLKNYHNNPSDRHTGYKTYDTIEDMKEDFNLKSNHFMFKTSELPNENVYQKKGGIRV